MHGMGLSASVVGASGYVGGELLRVLGQHPVVTAVSASAQTRAGTTFASVHPHLATSTDSFVTTESALAAEVDVCFSCLPRGVLAAYSGRIGARVVVDLSDDHRAKASWVYGLTELVRTELPDATRIANPGCYPTATLLALAPFFRRGLVTTPAIVDALSGVSGAGRSSTHDMSFGEMHANARAYGTTAHRHVAEMERHLGRLTGAAVQVTFTPHLVPIARGLLVTARAPLASRFSDNEAVEVLRAAYDDEPFVQVTEEWPETKAVVGSNRAVVSARVDERAGMLVASAAIDNLGKGAAGQAIQNANLALGVEETAGLSRDGIWP